MEKIIDVAWNVGPHAEELYAQGVRSVIRYYNHQNSSKLPTKCLTQKEKQQLFDAGLTVGIAFQQRGGKDGHIEDFTPQTGERDALRALDLATKMDQPNGTAIYFCIDHDFYVKSHLDAIEGYFTAVKATINGAYRIGVYGSGTQAKRLLSKNLVDLVWLPVAIGWNGSKEFLQSGQWTLHQYKDSVDSPVGGFKYDPNHLNPAFGDFGAFGPVQDRSLSTPVALYEVIAKSGLIIRGGPSKKYPNLGALPKGATVHGLRLMDGWMQVDVDGNGGADGFMSALYLKPLAGGVPITANKILTPYEVAQVELNRGDVYEYPDNNNPPHNPRILLYLGTTTLDKADKERDETHWCSAFVNYCVEQAGMKGTRSARAQSWHDPKWGQDVTASPQEGDIVIFKRFEKGKEVGGHVGFFVSELGDQIKVLGGNQSDRVRYSNYPKDGPKGIYTYQLLSIRRP